jgi:hypothetical protein
VGCSADGREVEDEEKEEEKNEEEEEEEASGWFLPFYIVNK